MSEKGQKAGWTFGGLGGFLWLLVLAGIMFFKENYHASFFAFVFFAMGIAYLIDYAPWKHPTVPFWKIYLGLVILLFLSATAIICLWENPPVITRDRFSVLFFLFPILFPIISFGKKTWNDIQKK